MKLTPLDLRKQQFKKAFRGYDPDEVRGFIEKLAQDWEEALEEKRRAEERAEQGDEKLRHYERVELALQEALEAARETGRRAEDAAHQRARLIVEEAELRAQRILQDAEQERYNVRQDLVKLTGRQNEIAARLRAFLMSEMEILAQFQGDDPIGFIKLVAATEGASKEALPAARPRLGPAATTPDGAPDGASEEEAAPAQAAPAILALEVEDETAPAEAAPAEAAPAEAAPASTAEEPAAAEGSAREEEGRGWSPLAAGPPPPVEAEAQRVEPPPPPVELEAAPEAPPEAEAEPAAAPEEAAPSPAAFTYRDWLSGLARRGDAARPAEPAERPQERPAEKPPQEREPVPFGRTFFRTPAAEPPPEPAPTSDAARGWSLRSLVTGDREEGQPSSVVASEDERERIRRILEDLD